MYKAIIEPLEGRMLLAGDVSVVFARGILNLRGDASANLLIIEADGAGVRVSGQDGTTLNGAAGPLVFPDPAPRVRVRLGHGDDRLILSGAAFAGDVFADAGRGADVLSVQSTTVQGNLRLAGGTGAKTIELRSSAVAGRTHIRTASQNDTVTLADSTFASRVTVATGRGNDAVVQSSVFNGGVRVKDGAGEDAVSVVRSFDFRTGEQGWVGGFADYPDGFVDFDADGKPLRRAEEAYDLQSGLRPLPVELGVGGTGFLLSGENRSADLFMFLKRRLGQTEGIAPGRSYQISFGFTFASNAPTGCGGAGSPGESVALKAGGAIIEPVAVSIQEGLFRFFRMNVDKGLQVNSGPAASFVDTIENGITCEAATPAFPYVSLERTHTHNVPVAAKRDGEVWLLVGTDSGFEGPTAIYYQRIEVTLTRVN